MLQRYEACCAVFACGEIIVTTGIRAKPALLYIYKMEDIILLHGAMGSDQQLDMLKALLEKKFRVHNLSLPGHGGSAIPEAFSIESFARFVEDYIDRAGIRPHIFGYSMGGYVAVYLAANSPDKVSSVIAFATKFLWDEAIAAKEMGMLDTDAIAEKFPEFAAMLQRRHQPNDWKLLAEKTKELLRITGIHSPLQIAHFNACRSRCLLIAGDRDKTVPLAETIAVYKQIPGAALAVVPNTAHAVEKTDMNTVAYLVERFCLHETRQV